MNVTTVTIAGAEIQISVADDNRLVIDISSGDIDSDLVHANGCPRLRLWINEGRMETRESDGNLVNVPWDTGM